MSQRRIDLISGAIGSLIVMIFVVGLAESISSGAAGFWGGLAFWIIVIFSLGLIWYDFWDSCVREK